MNVCICCRVSSEKQQDTSIPQQDKLLVEYCNRGIIKSNGKHEPLNIIEPPKAFREIMVKQDGVLVPFISRGFAFAESASNIGSFDDVLSGRFLKIRKEYWGMLEWIDANKDRLNIKGLIFHKQNRATRNYIDTGLLPMWGRERKIHVIFSDQPWDLLSTRSGEMMYGVQAVMDGTNKTVIREEVNKGFRQRFETGWAVSRAPFGYRNVNVDGVRIEVDPKKGPVARKMFEWYADGVSIKEIETRMRALGCPLTEPNIRLSLAKPFYVGKISWLETPIGTSYWEGGDVLHESDGKHEPLVDKATWDRVQARLAGRAAKPARGAARHGLFAFEGGLVRSKLDGSAMSADTCSAKGRVYHYYRTKGRPAAGGRIIRWRKEDMEEALAKELDKLVFPDDLKALFAYKLKKALSATSEFRRVQQAALGKRKEALESRLERLLELLIDGGLDKETYASKRDEAQAELDSVREKVRLGDLEGERTYEAIADAFEASQGLGKMFRVSNAAKKRMIAEAVCSKLEADDTTLYVEWRLPFRTLAELDPANTFLALYFPMRGLETSGCLR